MTESEEALIIWNEFKNDTFRHENEIVCRYHSVITEANKLQAPANAPSLLIIKFDNFNKAKQSWIRQGITINEPISYLKVSLDFSHNFSENALSDRQASYYRLYCSALDLLNQYDQIINLKKGTRSVSKKKNMKQKVINIPDWSKAYFKLNSRQDLVKVYTSQDDGPPIYSEIQVKKGKLQGWPIIVKLITQSFEINGSIYIPRQYESDHQINGVKKAFEKAGLNAKEAGPLFRKVTIKRDDQEIKCYRADWNIH